jgi:hypothetical protein
VRVDVGGRQLYDFDLVLADGSREPLEITRHVDRAAYETWERLGSAGALITPSLARVWVLALPHRDVDAAGNAQPYDVRKFRAEIEPALAALEGAGYETIALGRLQRELPTVFQTLLDLGIQDGFSRDRRSGEPAHISTGAPVGGMTLPDLVAAAIEVEAGKSDNEKKLAQTPTAAHRHLFVPFDSSSGAAFNALDRGVIGRLPNLPTPITTAWACARARVYVATPPAPWQEHALVPAVFDSPADWLL